MTRQPDRLRISDRKFASSTLRYGLFAFAFLALCSLPFASTRAQSATATLSGTVEDEKGAVIPGASVIVENVATNLRRQTTTNGDGSFTVPLLPPSTYTVRVEGHGFAPLQVNGVVLNVGDQKALRIELKAGNITETVQVTNEAPLINESPTVSTVIDRQFVGNLPLNGRSFQSLILLTPGVVLTPSSVVRPGQFSANGQRNDANYFTVDGVSANVGVTNQVENPSGTAGAQPALAITGGTNNLVSIDALEEFKIHTSTFSPEFGRSPGAQVQIVTRSGTNQFRGSLFNYLRNDVFDANDWFANANRLRKPPLRQNDFGVVVGGPVLLPRFGEGGSQPWFDGRDRMFFFFSYEGLRLRQPQVINQQVPSLTSRREAALPVQPLINAFPLPNGPDLINAFGQPTGFAQFVASYSDAITLDATSVRVDYTVSDRLGLFGRYNDTPSTSITRTSLNAAGLTSNQADTRTLTLGATMSITPQVINELRANYSRAEAGSLWYVDNFGGAAVPPDSFLFPSFTSRDTGLARGVFSYSGASAQYNVGRVGDNIQRQINLVDSLSVVKGAHQLKFGGDYRRLSPALLIFDYSLFLRFLNPTDVREGRVTSAQISTTEGVQPIYTNMSLYGQDTWKASRRLTVTYGLRWEVNPPPHEVDGKDAFTLTGLDDPATYALAPRGTPLYKTTYNNFAPRFGLAYQLSQARGRETVLRGGIGIFYDLGSNSIGLAYGDAFPFRLRNDFRNVALPLTAGQLARPVPPSFTPPFANNFYVYAPDFKLPYTIQGNFALEQSIGTNQTVSASYVAAVGRRLLRSETRLAPNPNFAGLVNIYRSDATSDYHALQLKIDRRLSRGLQALASYTWSHAIDEISDGAFAFSAVSREAADFDVRHAFSAAVTYSLPAPDLGAFAGAVLRGWSVDTIIRSQSATPVNIVAQQFVTVGGEVQTIRPDLIPGVPLYLDDPAAPGGRRFNNTVDPSRPGCVGPFCFPPLNASGQPLRQGTLGRNVMRGFPLNQVDLALRRQFNLGERFNLQFRAEFFNLFNHPNFGVPNNVLTSGTFGRATTMLGRSLGGLNPLYQIGGPRSIQLALKLNF